MGIVYCITNQLNGKKYIGCTKRTLQKRMKDHKDDSRRKDDVLHSDMRNMGLEAFYQEVLFSSDDPNELHSKESELIAEMKTLHPNGYNRQSGGLRGFEFDKEYEYRTANSPRSVRNCDTGEVFYSANKAAKSCGLSFPTVIRSCTYGIRILGRLFSFVEENTNG